MLSIDFDWIYRVGIGGSIDNDTNKSTYVLQSDKFLYRVCKNSLAPFVAVKLLRNF